MSGPFPSQDLVASCPLPSFLHCCLALRVYPLRYHHHCPWIGTCVGKNNTTAFHWFFIAVAVHFTVCIVVATQAAK